VVDNLDIIRISFVIMTNEVSKSENKTLLQLMPTVRVVRGVEKSKMQERRELFLYDKMIFITDSVEHC